MVYGAGASLEDLYGRRDLTNDQEGGNHRQIGIRGDGTEYRWGDLCGTYSGSSEANDHANLLLSSGPSCRANERGNQNFC